MAVVTIRHVSDPMEASMLVDLLKQEDITAFTPGNEHNAMMGGLLGSALNVPIRVDESDAERAMEILSALDDYDKVDAIPLSARDPSAHDGDGPYRGGPMPTDTSDRRKASVAIAAALILPSVCGAFGSGHFYARQYQRGFILLVSAWLCIVYGFREQWAWSGVVVVMVLDLVGAAASIRRRSE
ncbi:MAG: hypothetical protein ACI9KE_003730 [Polyangiales bacterium]|jgi:hypothetical protein